MIKKKPPLIFIPLFQPASEPTTELPNIPVALYCHVCNWTVVVLLNLAQDIYIAPTSLCDVNCKLSNLFWVNAKPFENEDDILEPPRTPVTQ